MPFSKPSHLRPNPVGVPPSSRNPLHAGWRRRARTIPAAALVSLAAIAIGGADAARASDGVLEINQTCATQTGCFPGDTAGLPVTINASGSYRLTSNLVTPNQNVTAIEVSAGSVSIDLGGFAIGRTDCIPGPTCFNASGPGFGITSVGSTADVYVHDGVILGMGNDGIHLDSNSIVERVRTRSNGGDGIQVGPNSSIHACISNVNSFAGIASTGANINVTESSTTSNTTDGIRVGANSRISGNTVNNNGDNGIQTGLNAQVSHNTSEGNDRDGIFTGAGAVVSENATYDNGSDGIEVGSGSLITQNTARNNTSFGLRLSTDSGYRANILSNNTGGTVTGGTNLFGNLCDGSTNCL